jgi:hypothetical protein
MNLTQVFKEYLEFKNYLLSKQEEFKKTYNDFAEKQLKAEDIDYNEYFDKVGIINVLESDRSKHIIKLYHYYNAYKDFIEVPQEIEDELKDVTMSYIFAIVENEHVVVDQDSLYLVDFSKCQSVNDLMTILSVVGFQFSPQHPGFQYIHQFLALDKPIPTRPQPGTEKASLELPKLKTLK